MKSFSSSLNQWLMGLSAAALSHLAMAQSGGASVVIDSFGETYAPAALAPANQTRVLVYRTPQAVSQMPVNIYLNGQYHASLLRGGYTEFCAEPGGVSIKAALDDASRLHLSKQDPGQRLNMQVGQTMFLKVDEAGQPGLAVLSMPASQANTEMANTRRQIHTISRAKAAVTCGEPAKPVAVAAPALPPRPPAPREYALETDALFEFGKAELRASGFNAIEALVQRLNQDYSSVDRIRVVGYTDAIGSVAFNKKLSQQRADVVAQQIAAHRVKPTRGIEAEGRGSIELSKTGCRNEPTPENKICHAPNRRVVVVITGARR